MPCDAVGHATRDAAVACQYSGDPLGVRSCDRLHYAGEDELSGGAKERESPEAFRRAEGAPSRRYISHRDLP